ncbi:ATP-binding protein [Ensifer adhaerens]|uniref:ATP-binding protein n=1 Tax=Ensifer adhaerens TaxID=106592 RepID=UPI001CC0C58A|nr:ATP-binding protein [Ensifer adhaerens]MBZ7924762.1 ATP-binding protein [Ensifer adhaerens]UAX96015.1 ATP-binding protein [Ensifer adhaerens]UAY04644.1 ATP-binding protein [Ensifer adhaerens]UAY10075.1 ATP-binding protein [Ensifer adhaerens]
MPNNFDQAAAVARIRAMIDPEKLKVADRIADLNARYIGLSRDQLVQSALAGMVASIATVDIKAVSKPDKRRIVAICGDSGAGKTRTLLEHTNRIQAMQPYVDDDGVEVSPLLNFNAPSPCPPRLLALTGLDALGYPVRRQLQEHQAWALFQQMLKSHRIMFVMIDEAQHAVDTADILATTKIGNAYKNLVQMPDWPVRLILAGVPPLASFLARKQLYNRRTVIRFEKLKGKSARETVETVLKKVIIEHAQLNLDTTLDGDLVTRLTYACDGEFGSVVQMVRGAVEHAIQDGVNAVTIDHFKRVYETYSGCVPAENIFSANDWRGMTPQTAFLRDEDHEWEEAQLEKKKRKTSTKFGVRP